MTNRLLILLISVLLFIFIFSNETKSANKESFVDYSIEKTTKDSINHFKEQLIGEWGIYETIDTIVTEKMTKKGKETLEKITYTDCNECPRIIFYDNLSATIFYPSGDKENINWEITDNKLKINYNERKNQGRIFSDNNYEIAFKKEKDFIELKLSEKGYKYCKILRR